MKFLISEVWTPTGKTRDRRTWLGNTVHEIEEQRLRPMDLASKVRMTETRWRKQRPGDAADVSLMQAIQMLAQQIDRSDPRGQRSTHPEMDDFTYEVMHAIHTTVYPSEVGGVDGCDEAAKRVVDLFRRKAVEWETLMTLPHEQVQQYEERLHEAEQTKRLLLAELDRLTAENTGLKAIMDIVKPPEIGKGKGSPSEA
jgi:hypothetical protein